MAMAAQTAGFEIRDQIMWIYSSGFPKSQDVGKSIDRQSGKAAHKAELAEVKAILKKLYSDSGKSTAEISRECGFNAGGYLKTDFKDKGWANNLPKDDKWLKLKSVLGCGDDYDDYFITTPQIKVGEKESGCFDQEFDNYTIGARSKTVDITASQTAAGQQWSGWGTALKPAHEPIVLARKPIKLSIAKNCQQWGVGAVNIDATRVPYDGPTDKPVPHGGKARQHKDNPGWMSTTGHKIVEDPQINEIGRFPSNVIGEIADYQKYFYCPKVGRRERHVGFDELPEPMFGNVQGAYGPDGNRMAVGFDNRDKLETHDINVMGKTPMCLDCNKTFNGTNDHGACDPSKKAFVEKRKPTIVGNNHPTVKPIELMKYLIQLITPAGGRVLDPFNGSGSTGCAAVELDYDYTGIELDEKYVAIAEKRIAAWYHATHNTTFTEVFEIEH
jgi:hypothetical protein